MSETPKFFPQDIGQPAQGKRITDSLEDSKECF